MPEGYNGTAHPSPDHDRLLYRVDEAAKLLAIGRDKMYELIGTGEVKSLKIGHYRRITPAALDEFIARLAADGGAAGAA